MRFTKTLAYEHLARKNREGEGDIEDKFLVIGILKEFFGLHGLTGELVQIDCDSYRLPDILIRSIPTTIIELDGGIHGYGDQVTKREKDIQRDEDYKKAGYNLIVINKEETAKYDYHLVIPILQQGGLKLCK